LLFTSVFIVSCGGPSGGGSQSAGNPAKEQPSGIVQYSPMFADISDSGISIEGSSSLNLMATRRQFAAQPIIIKNNSMTAKPISILNTLDVAIEIDTRCPVTLEPRRVCVVTLYYNRQYDQQISATSSKGSFSITSGALSSNIFVAAGVDGDTVEEEISDKLSVSKISISFSSIKGDKKRDFIVIRNTSKFSLPSNYIDNLLIPTSGFSVINNCPTNIQSRRICVLVVQHDSELSDSGLHSVAISIAEKTISLSATVDPAPLLTSNPNISWNLTPPSSAIWTFPSSFNFTLQSNLDGQSLMTSDFSFGQSNQWPAAFAWSNSCPSVLDRVRICNLSISYDPEMFHFGVEFSKTAMIKDQEVSFELTGNSPCNPSHPNPRSDAALGKKLNSNKSACVDNLGVFDSPDSVYGHAVFQ
jgi:hypothetical protein